MSTRRYRKDRWQYDTDCRFEFVQGIPRTVISPRLPASPYYSRLPGNSRRSRNRTRGVFRPCYLRKAVQWMREWSRKMSVWLRTKHSF
jgi:hypothetical protein